jgi:hypothetical protein
VVNTTQINEAKTLKKTTTSTRRGGFTVANTETTSNSWQETAESAKQMAVKGGMVLFWLVAGIAIIKDIIDIFSVLLDLVGLGLTATAVGAVVGVPLAVLSEIIDKISGLLIDFTIVAYFGYIGGGFALRLVIMSVGAIIDAVPGLDVLPLTTVSFFAAYLLGRTIKKATETQSSSISSAAGKVARVGARIGKVLAV